MHHLPKSMPQENMVRQFGLRITNSITGAEVVLYDRLTKDRIQVAQQIADERGGLVVVPPYDNRDIIAGQVCIGNICLSFPIFSCRAH